MSKIHTSEASTDKVPNASPTAASMTTDLNGMAVLVLDYIYYKYVWTNLETTLAKLIGLITNSHLKHDD